MKDNDFGCIHPLATYLEHVRTSNRSYYIDTRSHRQSESILFIRCFMGWKLEYVLQSSSIKKHLEANKYLPEYLPNLSAYVPLAPNYVVISSAIARLNSSRPLLSPSTDERIVTFSLRNKTSPVFSVQVQLFKVPVIEHAALWR